MDSFEVKNIPKDRIIAYRLIVVDYRAQKKNPNQVRITAGGTLITYLGDISTATADLTTTKNIWNSVLSNKRAQYMCIDI